MSPTPVVPWFGFLAMAALVFVIVRGVANPRARPFVFWLVALSVLGLMFLGFSVHEVTEMPHPPVAQRVEPQMIRSVPPAPQPMPVPPQFSADWAATRPKMTLLSAFRQAIVQAWTTRGSAPVAEAPEKPAKTNQPNAPVKPRPPDWVNAAPTLGDHCYRVSVPVGPFTTLLECKRELPRKLQGVVAEYAELSLGPEAAAVRLPDDALQELVSETWTDVRPMEIGGGSQDMVSLHALVTIDDSMQKRIASEAQRLVIGHRVQGESVVFGGLLGLLALAWGGLKLATRSRDAAVT